MIPYHLLLTVSALAGEPMVFQSTETITLANNYCFIQGQERAFPFCSENGWKRPCLYVAPREPRVFYLSTDELVIKNRKVLAGEL